MEATETKTDVFGALAGYEPEELKDGFDPIKGNFTCDVIKASIETYDGDVEALQGVEKISLELVIGEGQEFEGRHFFKNFWLRSDDGGEYTDKKGTIRTKKTSVQKTADAFHTVGLNATSRDKLMESLEALYDMQVRVRASILYKDADDNFCKKSEAESTMQTVQLKGRVEAGSNGNGGSTETPF